MKKFLQISLAAFAVILFLATVYIEQFFTGVAFLIGMLLSLIVFILPDKIKEYFEALFEERIGFFIVLFLLMYFMPLLHLGLGLRTIKHDNNVSIVSSFFPFGKKLATGLRVDTLKMARAFNDDYSVDFEDMYELVRHDGSSVLFSQHDMILEGYDLQFSLKDMNFGYLHVCQYIDSCGAHECDMYGNDVNTPEYKPRIITHYDDYTVVVSNR